MARRPKLNPARRLAIDPSLKDICRFLKFVEVQDECWIWTGFCDENGYGQFRYRDVSVGAHRFAHAIFNGIVEARLHVHHVPPPECVGHGCVRPSHISTETPSANGKEGRNRRGLNRVNEQQCYPIHDLSDSMLEKDAMDF